MDILPFMDLLCVFGLSCYCALFRNMFSFKSIEEAVGTPKEG
ncbi:unnamed protein product [marine sediment metagenome]|uniref:Uncharacterized protein n=1 Tax=marine sediment metagenome TaxID=412755 RepID=X1MHC0_9ZZZZ